MAYIAIPVRHNNVDLNSASDVNQLQENIEYVSNSVSGEALARDAADDVLQGNIDGEALARSTADGTLQGNINSEASARSTADTTLQDNIDTHILNTAVVHGATSEATAYKIAIRDSAGRLKVASPSVNADVANKEYVDTKVAGGGNLSTNDTSATDGEIVVTDGPTGKLHKKSGYRPSSFMPSSAACGRLSWNDNNGRIQIDGGGNNAKVNYADSAGTVSSLNGHNVTELTNNAGYISSIGRCYPRLSNGNDVNFIMSVNNTDEPLWLWGGVDSTNMYPYKQ